MKETWSIGMQIEEGLFAMHRNPKRYYYNVVRRTLRTYKHAMEKAKNERERTHYEYALCVQCRDFSMALKVPYSQLLKCTTGKETPFYV